MLFINDHSNDDPSVSFSKILESTNVKIIDNKGKGKKAAIETGISNAKFSWILCTDADCIFDTDWLTSCNELIEHCDGDLFVLPVIIGEDTSLTQAYQYYESLSSIAVTEGYFHWKQKVLLASGANLLYKKEAFLAIDPFKENKRIASGDDMFLLEGFKYATKKISLSSNKGLWVRSSGESNWTGILSQRIRWLKKMKHLSSQKSFSIGAYFLLFQIILLIFGLLSLSNILFFMTFLLFVFIKSLLDFNLIKKKATQNERSPRWETMILLEFFYLFTIPIIAILALLWNPKWKGRKIGS